MVAADHLQVPRQHGLFQHHGIDLGDGTVAHYLEGKEILRSSITVFASNQIISIINHDQCSKRGVTLRRAMSRIGEQRYNLLFNNCEHFANWCKTGSHQSLQVEELLNISNIGTKALKKLLPTSLLKRLNLLINQGLLDNSSREKAIQALRILKELRKKLLIKLRQSLELLENSMPTESYAKSQSHQNLSSRSFLLQGQILADELSAVEDLESKILQLIKHSESKVVYPNDSHCSA